MQASAASNAEKRGRAHRTHPGSGKYSCFHSTVACHRLSLSLSVLVRRASSVLRSAALKPDRAAPPTPSRLRRVPSRVSFPVGASSLSPDLDLSRRRPRCVQRLPPSFSSAPFSSSPPRPQAACCCCCCVVDRSPVSFRFASPIRLPAPAPWGTGDGMLCPLAPSLPVQNRGACFSFFVRPFIHPSPCSRQQPRGFHFLKLLLPTLLRCQPI